MIPARWALTAPPDPERTRLLAETLRVPEPLAALLIQRGMGAPDIARAYLRPELDRLADPAAWAGMAAAVDAIVRAVGAGTPILVHGDYDVDGQCASALLTRTLRAVGATAHAFVPHRLRDGYDFGPAGLAEARRGGAGLTITCAFGITARGAWRAARAAGSGGWRRGGPGVEDAGRLALDGAACPGRSGGPRRQAAARGTRRLHPGAAPQRGGPDRRRERRPAPLAHRRPHRSRAPGA